MHLASELRILEKDQKLRTFVCDRLAEGWTPEQIAGWLKAGNERGLLWVRGHLRLHLSRRPQGRIPLALSDPPSQAPKAAPGETLARYDQRPHLHPRSTERHRSPRRHWPLGRRPHHLQAHAAQVDLTRSATPWDARAHQGKFGFPFLSAAFRCISRCEGGSEERKMPVGSKRWGVALRVGIQAMLVLHERKSRVTLAARLTGKTAAETISVMLAGFGRINPAHAVRSLSTMTRLSPQPEFRREVQHPSALSSLLDFPFLGAAFASRNAAEGGGEEGKSELSLVSPSVPRCCTSRQNPPSTPCCGLCAIWRPGSATPTPPGRKAVSKTPMVDYDAGCRVTSTSIDCPTRKSRTSS